MKNEIKNNKQLIGHILAALTALVWGTTFVSSKILLRVLTPQELLLDRFVIGYAVLWLMKPKFLRFESIKQELSYAAAGLSGVCLYYLMENMALTYTQAANVSVIVSTAPLFVSILAHFFLEDEKLTPMFFAGFACAIAGIILLSFGGGSEVEFNGTGDMICILAALLWGIYSVIIKGINKNGNPVILNTRRIFFYGIIFMIPLAALSGYELHAEEILQPVNLANLLFLGIIACAVCFVSWNRAVDLLGAVKTSAYIYAIPVITLIASVAILDETVTPLMAVGVALTVVGLVLSERKPKAAAAEVSDEYCNCG